MLNIASNSFVKEETVYEILLEIRSKSAPIDMIVFLHSMQERHEERDGKPPGRDHSRRPSHHGH